MDGVFGRTGAPACAVIMAFSKGPQAGVHVLQGTLRSLFSLEMPRRIARSSVTSSLADWPAGEKMQRRPVQKAAAAVARSLLAGLLASMAGTMGLAQSSSLPEQNKIRIEGKVRNSVGEAVAGAKVRLLKSEHAVLAETTTRMDGSFSFSGSVAGIYTVKAEKAEWGEALARAISISGGESKHIEIVLGKKNGDDDTSVDGSEGSDSSAGRMEFDDQPNFTIAGVTDWSNVGLHGSGTELQTSEALARDTRKLDVGAATDEAFGNVPRESEAQLRAQAEKDPGSFEANHKLGEFYGYTHKYAEAIPVLEAARRIDSGNLVNSYELALAYILSGDLPQAREIQRTIFSEGKSAEAHRRAGMLDERLGDPLGAVREYERAAQLDGSATNYFSWGSELLVHRAVEPAVEVFTKGARMHPDAAHLLLGLGAALYAKGSYDAAAENLCMAADLQPGLDASYDFLGKIEKASADTYACSFGKLASFAKDRPDSAVANYYYGLILWKRARGASDVAELRRARELVEKAVTLAPTFAEGYLQLGIIDAERGEFAKAVDEYKKAVEVNPGMGEAHFRLGQLYKRMGEREKAEREFAAYKEMEKQETAARERERREMQQFLVILENKPEKE